MHTTQTPAFRQRMKIYWGGVSLLFLLLSFDVQGQDYVKSYLFSDNLQHYTPIPVSGVDEHALVGTIENRDAHFLRVDASGVIQASKRYSDNELHAVSIVQPDDGTGDFLLTCLIRTLPGVSPQQDGIKILRVNNAGSVLSSQNIFCDLNTNTYTDMYPLHSIYYGESLYICGYTTINTAYPNSPDNTHDKKAFVIRWDPSTNGVVASISLNSTFSNNPTLTEDYDMAIRMKVNNAGQLYVTGSCNVITGNTVPVYSSGILSITLNTSTLNKISEAPIAEPGGKDAYGVDMIELPNTPGYFILGNDCSPSTTLGVGGYTNPERLHITYTGASLNVFDKNFPPFPDSRFLFTHWSYAWGLNFLPSMDGQDNAIVAGLSTHWGNCSFNTYPHLRNITGILTEFSLSGDPQFGWITATNNYWKFYETLSGTGHESLANSYHNFGGHISNNSWGPCLATRRPLGSFTNDDIFMYGPWWDGNSTSGQLNMKITRTDLVGDLPSCPTDINCNTVNFLDVGVQPSQFPQVWPFTITHITNPTLSVLHPVTVIDAEITTDTYDHLDVRDCEVNSFWKAISGASSSDNLQPTFSVYPNPASQQISIRIENPGIEKIRVFLMDITGKEIEKCFDGKPKPVIDIKLPSLSPGLYLLRVEGNGHFKNIQRITIK